MPMPLPPQFQFHKGTIRTQWANMLVNSIMTFQFHKGTIRTFVVVVSSPFDSCFNSIKVRLERFDVYNPQRNISVSIP